MPSTENINIRVHHAVPRLSCSRISGTGYCGAILNALNAAVISSLKIIHAGIKRLPSPDFSFIMSKVYDCTLSYNQYSVFECTFFAAAEGVKNAPELKPYMEICKDIRHTLGVKDLYSQRKETIARLLGTAKGAPKI